MSDVVEQHYVANRSRLLKRLTFQAGTEWDAEDVLQDAYERAARYYPSYDNQKDFGGWFNVILTNALRAHKNASKGYYVSLDDIEEESVDCSMLNKELLKEIYQLIKTKNPVQQEVLSLHIKHGYRPVEISHITEHKYITCSKIISRFKEELKEIYPN